MLIVATLLQFTVSVCLPCILHCTVFVNAQQPNLAGCKVIGGSPVLFCFQVARVADFMTQLKTVENASI